MMHQQVISAFQELDIGSGGSKPTGGRMDWLHLHLHWMAVGAEESEWAQT